MTASAPRSRLRLHPRPPPRPRPRVRLALLSVFLGLAAGAPPRRGPGESWKALRAACERRPCGALPAGEEDACVSHCTCPACHALVYAASPLEPGEVDAVRAARFVRCLRPAEEMLRARGAWPPRLDAAGSSLEGGQPGEMDAERLREYTFGSAAGTRPSAPAGGKRRREGGASGRGGRESAAGGKGRGAGAAAGAEVAADAGDAAGAEVAAAARAAAAAEEEAAALLGTP